MDSEEDEITPLLTSLAHRQMVRRRKAAVFIILVSLTLERLAYFTLAANFFLFLNKGSVGPTDASAWGSTQAMEAVLVLSGISHLSAFFGGWAADAFMGRFRAILLGFMLYVTGYALLTSLSAHALPVCHFDRNNSFPFFIEDVGPNNLSPCSEVIYPIAVLIGFGVGAIKANIAPLGAAQTVDNEAFGFSSRRSFFNWYYWCINIGSLLGIGILCFVEQNVAEGFVWSYLIATCCLGMSCLLLLFGCGLYRDIKPVGSLVSQVCRVVYDAFQNRRTSQTSTPVPEIDFFEDGDVIERSSWRRRFSARPNSFLDWAKVEFGGSFSEDAVEQVKALGPILFVFASLLPHWLVYFQIETTFQAQGLHMRLGFGDHVSHAGFFAAVANASEFQVPAAWLTLFDVIFLIVLIPILNSYFYPFLERRGIPLTLLSRMTLGMGFSFFAAVSAGLLETHRRNLWNSGNDTHITQVISGTTYEAVDLSVLWQLPQYALIGLAEAFASVAGLEYAYSASPRTTQGLIMGLFCASQGLGSFFGLGLLNLCRLTHWINALTVRDIEEDRLDLYFFVLAGIQGMSLVAFAAGIYLNICCAKNKPQRSTSQAGFSVDGVGNSCRELDTSHSIST